MGAQLESLRFTSALALLPGGELQKWELCTINADLATVGRILGLLTRKKDHLVKSFPLFNGAYEVRITAPRV